MPEIFKYYDDVVDTTFLYKNREQVLKAICNCGVEAWQMTGGFCNVLEEIDEKHWNLRFHRDVQYDLSNIKDKQLFEQLYFKIYNVGQFKVIKKNYQYNDAFTHFEFMREFFESLPFKRIREILIIILPAGVETVIHRDPTHLNPDRFMYLTEDHGKPFFVYNQLQREKVYVQGLASEWSWEEWHGADSRDYATYAFKVKGDIDDDKISAIRLAKV